MHSSYGSSPSRQEGRRSPPQSQKKEGRLSYSRLQSDILLKGQDDIKSLKNLQNVILSLRRQFSSNPDGKIQFATSSRQDLDRRLLLLENQVEGLMRRKITYTSTNQEEGLRSLDYSTLLSEKQNQIIELQKKIQNLQNRLRKATSREIQLQNHIMYLADNLKLKESIIENKNDIIFNQVATTNLIREALIKIKRNVDANKYKIEGLDRIVMNDVTIPETGSHEIRAESLTRQGALSRSRVFTDMSVQQQLSVRIVELFRQFQRVMNNQNGGISPNQVEMIMEGFLMSHKQGRLFQKCQTALRRQHLEQAYHRLRQNISYAAGIYRANLEKLRRDNPNIRVQLENNLFEVLSRENVEAYRVENGTVFVDAFTEKTVQVPVQDVRTKHLIHLFAQQMKKYTEKYPQLLKQMDSRLTEFFQQEIIDCIEVDQVDKLVNIVKYVPQVVKVENVYAYSSQKTRKVQFHLRVLIKALLEELEKIRKKTGMILEMDEGVIGMINAEIMASVNVDDILKVFRPVPKIVQVEKVVQKIVEKRVQVPMVVPISKQVQKIVQIEKIVQIQKIVNVPLEIPVVQAQLVDRIVPIENIIERVVEVPTIVDRVVYVDREVPKIVEVPTTVEKIVEVEKVVEVERISNHIKQQPQQVEIVREKIVPVETVVEKIVQVPVIKEKIVQKIIEVPKIQIIEKIVEKAVPIVEYRKALQVNNHIQTIHKPVKEIVQKIVPVEKVIERIVEVPQIVEKIKEVIVEKVEIREVQVIREKLVTKEVPKQVEVVQKQLVEVIKEVPVEVEKIIEVPVIQEVIKKIVQIVQKPIIQKIENTTVKEVYLRDPLIVHEPKIVEVQKVINHYIEVPKTVKFIEEKIVEIPRNVERIKEVRVYIDRVVQKMVQVPKVVEVEKIVEKVVVVPRVIEKVVEVPQIVQKIVEKQVEKIVLKQVQKVIQIPVIQQKPVQVEVVKNIYIEVQKPVDRVVDKLVTVDKFQEKIKIQEVRIQNTVEVIKQVHKTLNVDKIVPAYYEKTLPVEIERTQIVPVQIPVPVELVVEKSIPIREVVEKIIQVPQFIEKIVAKTQEKVKVEYIEKVVEKVVVDERVKEVEKIVPYIQEVIKEIPTIVEKVVTIESKVQEIITAQQIVQKIVQRSTTIPRIYQVQKTVPKLIQVPQIIQIEKIIPQVIRVNQYIQQIVEKVVEVPRIIEKIKQIEVEREKIVAVNNTETQIVEVEKMVEKIAILQQMKEVTKNVNHIEKVIKIVQQIERIPVEIPIKEEVLIQVPQILEKIVEKIIVMPQIVEVLKYIHEVSESNELLTVENEQQYRQHEMKLIQLSRNLKPSLNTLLKEIRHLKNNSQLGSTAATIQQFLLEWQKIQSFPKLVRIQSHQRSQQILTKQKIVKVPSNQNQHQLRKEISMSLLIEKLIIQLKRISEKTQIKVQLDQEIKMIFFPELMVVNRRNSEKLGQESMEEKLLRFTRQIQAKFESLGGWGQDHMLMLNTILQQRFNMAEIIENAYVQIQKAQNQQQDLTQLYHQEKNSRKNCEEMLNRLSKIYRSYPVSLQEQTSQIQKFIQQAQQKQSQQKKTHLITQSQMLQHSRSFMREAQESEMSEIYERRLREKQFTIEKLRQQLQKVTKQRTQGRQQLSSAGQQQYIKKLQQQIQDLRKSKAILQTRADFSQVETAYRSDMAKLRQRNAQLERQNSYLRSDLDNTRRELRTLHENQQFIMRKSEAHRVQESQWLSRRSPQRLSAGSLSHSEIRRVDQSLTESQLSAYQPSHSRAGQSPQKYKQSLLEKRQGEEVQGLMTPSEAYKYRSPQTTGMKYTQSILKEQTQSLAARSLHGQLSFGTPGSIRKQEISASQQKQQPEGSPRSYRYYYSPEQREKERKDPK